jgi:hypothetical protein
MPTTTYQFSLKNQFGLNNVQVFDFTQQPEGGKQADFNFPAPADSNYMTTGRKTENLTTWLSTKVFADIILSNGKTGTDEKTVQLVSALVGVDQKVIMERTNFNGRNGAAKEYWALDDFSVRVQGAILDSRPDYYPQAEVKKLIDLLKLPQSLQVVSRYLQMFGIYELVLDSFSFAPIDARTNAQFFEILFYSDEPIEIALKNEK